MSKTHEATYKQQLDVLNEHLENERSLGGCLRRLSQIDREHGFLTDIQKFCVARENRSDIIHIFPEIFTKTQLQKYGREKVKRFKLQSKGKTFGTFKTRNQADKRVTEYGRLYGTDSVLVKNFDITEYDHQLEAKFSLQEILRRLQRIDLKLSEVYQLNGIPKQLTTAIIQKSIAQKVTKQAIEKTTTKTKRKRQSEKDKANTTNNGVTVKKRKRQPQAA